MSQSRLYSQQEARNLRPQTFGTMTGSGLALARAYLKEHATKRFGVAEEDVYPVNMPMSSVLVDELVEVEIDGALYFKIEMA